MWSGETGPYEGKHYHLAETLCVPRPIQKPHPPILIGGGGEKKTLRLVAKYADACNIFGDVATIRRKLEVLDRHCEEAGRDPREITKTRLGGLVIADSTAEADRKARLMAEARGMDPARVRDYLTVGDPDLSLIHI